MNRLQKYGKFTVCMSMTAENPGMLIAIQREIGIVAAAPSMVHCNCIDFIGFSHHFDEIKEGDEIPTYEVMLTRMPNNDEYTVAFMRRKDAQCYCHH